MKNTIMIMIIFLTACSEVENTYDPIDEGGLAPEENNIITNTNIDEETEETKKEYSQYINVKKYVYYPTGELYSMSLYNEVGLMESNKTFLKNGSTQTSTLYVYDENWFLISNGNYTCEYEPR